MQETRMKENQMYVCMVDACRRLALGVTFIIFFKIRRC